ncbi:MAG: hypothetical protein Q9226_009280, partial [Calogaya cf. arnoldii]
MAGIVIGDVNCPPMIEKSVSITTHHQFLKSLQTILERSIHNFLWRDQDPLLKSRSAPHEMTERDRGALYRKSCTSPVSNTDNDNDDERQEQVTQLLLRAKAIRNNAAHHQLLDAEKSQLCYEHALTLTSFLNDEDAARKIRLT